MDNKYVYGINSIEEILNSEKRKIFKILFISDLNPKIKNIIEIAKKKGIPCDLTNKNFLDKLTNGASHQGIVAYVSPIKEYSVYQALNLEKDINKTRWIATDSLTGINNLGNIIRSAVCFGFSAIIIPERRNARITPAVEKIASGAIEKINIIPVKNLNQTIIELKEKKFWVYGSATKGENIMNVDFLFPLLLIIGSEEKGMHQKTLQHCDKIINIPQTKNFDSLNAATAAAIIMYEISKRIKT